MLTKIILIGFLVSTVLFITVNALDLNEGVTISGDTKVNLTAGRLEYNDYHNNIVVTTTLKIDGVDFSPSTSSKNGNDLVWSSSETGVLGLPDPVIKLIYSYNGNELKEKIILKEKRELIFPIIISPNSEIIESNGGFRVIPLNSRTNSMYSGISAGVVISKPYGIDSDGKYVEMRYIYKNNALYLTYDTKVLSYEMIDILVKDNKTGDEIKKQVRSPIYTDIIYPITIDPTLYLGSYVSYSQALLHMNGTSGGTSFPDMSGKVLTVDGGVSTNTSVKVLGSASARFNGDPDRLYYANVTDLNMGLDDYTISYWVNITTYVDSGMIFIKGRGGGFPQIRTRQVGTAGALDCLEYDGGSAVSLTTPDGFAPLGKWTHIVAIRNASGIYMWNSSTNVFSGSGAPVNVTGTKVFSLGWDYDPDYTQYSNLKGYLDEFAIWKGVQIPISELYPQDYEIGTAIPPVTTFSTNTTGGIEPVYVQFNETSVSSGTSWNWSFTNITPGNNTQVWFSTIQNTTHGFTGGNYSIKLNSTNSGGSNISTQVTFINVSFITAPVAEFSADNTTVCKNNPIQFTDASSNSPTSWYWDFGDTGTGTTQDISHSYTTGGLYTVKLKASNFGGFDWENKTNYITVNSCEPPPSITNLIGDASVCEASTWTWIDPPTCDGITVWINKLFKMNVTPGIQTYSISGVASGIYNISTRTYNTYGYNLSFVNDTRTISACSSGNVTAGPSSNVFGDTDVLPIVFVIGGVIILLAYFGGRND